ncbi:MAG: ATP-binding protein, partial [Promethearchaeota archaeon]
MKDYFDYISPCPSSLFVGREREINLFKDQMKKVMSGEKSSKGIIIHGRPGIGKTSLINKLKTVASSCYVISKEVPLEGSQYFFDDLKGEILDVIKKKLSGKPKKRGKKGKNAPYLQRSPINKEKYFIEFFKKFIKGLDKNQKNIAKMGKSGIVVFIDKIERFVYLDLMIAFTLLKGILEKITTEIKGKPFNIPILFVIAAWERYYPRIKYILTNFEEIGVPTLNMADSKDLLAKYSSRVGISFTDEVSSLVIESSSNIPQMILYNAGYINAHCEGAREINKAIWFNLENTVKSGFDREIENIPEEEHKIFVAFSMLKENFAEVITLAQMTEMEVDLCASILHNLFERNIVIKEGE